MTRVGIPLALAVTLAVAASSCSSSDPDADAALVVFAASSLTAAYTEIGDAFATENPGADVTFSFGGSSSLATQINEGAPADVFASADQAQMDVVSNAGNTEGYIVPFATNSLAIVVGRGNPHGIAALADLADPELVVILAAPEVPVGAYSAQALERAGVTVTPRSYEESVKAVVNKVGLGEADAGIAFATDIPGRTDVDAVAIDPEENVTATYLIAALDSAGDPALAQRFVQYVSSPSGQAILARHGFGTP